MKLEPYEGYEEKLFEIKQTIQVSLNMFGNKPLYPAHHSH